MLADIVKKFESKRIGVIGDVMLDTFTYGHVERMSPEAPVPIVRVARVERMPGGAGNVATNAAALGAAVMLVARVGDDEAGRVLLGLLATAQVDVSGIQTTELPTIEKNRIVADGAHALRFDQEVVAYAPEDDAQTLARIVALMPKWDALIIADYAKGFVSEELAKGIVEAAALRSLPVVVDTKPVHQDFFRGAALMTPNANEAREISGSDDIDWAGKALQELFDAPILLTRGADGMTLFAESAEPYTLSARASAPVDVSGAGDTVTVVCALALAAGSSLSEAAELATVAAGIVVGKPGTAVVTLPELLQELS